LNTWLSLGGPGHNKNNYLFINLLKKTATLALKKKIKKNKKA